MNSVIQSLEPRRLLAAALNGGTLSIEGTSGNDGVQIEANSSDTSQLTVILNGQSQSFVRADVARIRIFCGGGNDNVNLINGPVNFNIPVTAYGGAGNDFLGGDLPSVGRFRGYGEAGTDTIRITGQSRDFAYGGPDDDTIGTNGGRDYCSGDDGDDNINGGSGNDRLFGGLGDDSINGGEGSADAPNRDFIDGGPGADNLSGRFSNDTIFGREGSDIIFGGDARDSIEGGDGVDTIFADSGNDTMHGGGSPDRIFGGPDADTFSIDDSDDEAFDFEEGVDRWL